jgi:hypothetical protein
LDDQVEMSSSELLDLQTSTLESGAVELGGDILELSSEVSFVTVEPVDLGDGKELTLSEDS